MCRVQALTGTTDPVQLLGLWKSRDERAATTQKSKERLENVIAKKRLLAEGYQHDLDRCPKPQTLNPSPFTLNHHKPPQTLNRSYTLNPKP